MEITPPASPLGRNSGHGMERHRTVFGTTDRRCDVGHGHTRPTHLRIWHLSCTDGENPMENSELKLSELEKATGGMASRPGPRIPLIPPTTGPTIPVEPRPIVH